MEDILSVMTTGLAGAGDIIEDILSGGLSGVGLTTGTIVFFAGAAAALLAVISMLCLALTSGGSRRRIRERMKEKY